MLPRQYKELLNFANGGSPERDSIRVIDGQSETTYSIDHFYHLGDDRTKSLNLWRELARWGDVLGAKRIPFGRDGMDNQLFLDFRECKEPSVKMCIHDDGFRIVPLASSFEKFIDKLEVNPDYI